MRALVCLAVLAAFVLLAGCAGSPCGVVKPGVGWLYADYKAPVDIDADPTKYVEKSGEASVENILGWILTGDASIEAAAKDGGISNIHYIDYKFKNILGFYTKFTTVVYGD